MQLLGRWSWYLPSKLRWLPRIGIEGPAPAAVEAPRPQTT